MSELLQVRVNPVVMWGFDIPQTEGLFINEDGFKGWDSGTPTRRDAVPIPGGHGQFDVPVVRDAATTAIDGTARAFTAAGLQQLGDLVNAVGADGSRVKLTVSDRYVTRWAWARLAEVDFIDSGHREGDLYWASFRFLLNRPDFRSVLQARMEHDESEVLTRDA